MSMTCVRVERDFEPTNELGLGAVHHSAVDAEAIDLLIHWFLNIEDN